MRTDATHWTERLTRGLANGWQRWRERRSEIGEIGNLEEGEIERLAHDLAISSQELRQLANAGPGGADLLYARCKSLGIDTARLRARPEISRELERVCSLCANKRQCAHELETDPSSAQIPSFCPNESTLVTLKTSKAS